MRVKFVNRREFVTVAPSNKNLCSNNLSEHFETTCLGFVGSKVSAPEITNAAADHKSEMVGRRFAPMQSLLIPLMGSEILLIVSHLIPRSSFLSGQQSANELTLLRLC